MASSQPVNTPGMRAEPQASYKPCTDQTLGKQLLAQFTLCVPSRDEKWIDLLLRVSVLKDSKLLP